MQFGDDVSNLPLNAWIEAGNTADTFPEKAVDLFPTVANVLMYELYELRHATVETVLPVLRFTPNRFPIPFPPSFEGTGTATAMAVYPTVVDKQTRKWAQGL